MQNRFHNAVDVRDYVMIPEANDSKSKFFEFRGSLFVSDNLLGVLPAIQLNDQSRFERGKIGNVSADCDLSSEFISIEPASAQMFPKQFFCFGFVPAKFARDLQRSTPSPYPLPQGESTEMQTDLSHLTSPRRGEVECAKRIRVRGIGAQDFFNAEPPHPTLSPMGRG